MTKLLTTTTLLLTLLVSPSLSDDHSSESENDYVTGVMLCHVVSTSLTKMEQGKEVKFSGYKDYIQTGHQIKLSYIYWRPSDLLNEIVINGESNNVQLNWFSKADFKERDESERRIKPRTMLTKEAKVRFGRDDIHAKFILDGELNLARYYKSDWHGIYTLVVGVQVFNASLDCRHQVDKVDTIIDDLEKKGY